MVRDLPLTLLIPYAPPTIPGIRWDVGEGGGRDGESTSKMECRSQEIGVEGVYRVFLTRKIVYKLATSS